MSSFYARNKDHPNWKIFMPEPGMMCALDSSLAGRWIRGIVQSRGQKKVNVWAVDAGFQEEVCAQPFMVLTHSLAMYADGSRLSGRLRKEFLT